MFLSTFIPSFYPVSLATLIFPFGTQRSINMFFSKAAILTAFALRATCAHFKIPEVENTVDHILYEYSHGINNERNESYDFHLQQRDAASYWYESIPHQGISAFGPSGYEVFRNVKDFGAKGTFDVVRGSSSSLTTDCNLGDGANDDTAAINAAMNAGGRCGQGCPGSTVTPAIVYFPSGTYILSSSIIDQYYTQIIGNPNNPPILKATTGFTGFGFIDGDTYYSKNPNWGTTNVFWRQVRNFVFDYSNVPISSSLCGIHWPTAQSTSLQNLVFQMSPAAGTQHVGIFSESGTCQLYTYFLMIQQKEGEYCFVILFTFKVGLAD
jgi:glucan 1,3-beta-glucosidase